MTKVKVKVKELVILGRTDLIKKQVLGTKLVDLGNGQGVYVKELSARDKNEYEETLLDKKSDGKGGIKFSQSLKNVLAKLVVWTACDEKGKLIFKPEEAATISHNMRASQMDKIANAAKKLNKLTNKDMEELTKNSEPDREDSSNSDSVGK